MSIPHKSASETSFAAGIDEQKLFSVLTLPVRRKLLLVLATGGPQTAANLMHLGEGGSSGNDPRLLLQAMVKNLALMVEAGIVSEQDDPSDRRRRLYRLSDAVKVTQNGDETIFDFGGCVVRLGPDNN